MDNSNNSRSVDATKGKYDNSTVSHVDINNSGYNKGTGNRDTNSTIKL